MLRILYLSVFLLFHPVHVTLTSLDYNPDSGGFSVFVKMYYDDFLRDYKLSKTGKENVDFSYNDSASFSVMQKYMSEKVMVAVNDKQVGGKLKNISLADNEISINLEYGKVKKPRKVTVTNLIMTTLYGDQANMLIVRVNDFEEGVRLTPEMTEKTFVIK
jgi:hypothetical protein